MISLTQRHKKLWFFIDIGSLSQNKHPPTHIYTNLNSNKVEPTLCSQRPSNHCLTATRWAIEKDTFRWADAKLGEYLRE